MREVNVSCLFEDLEPSELSGSVAERGKNAGPETWANSLEAAATVGLQIDDREGVKAYFAEFGAWSDEEIAAWTETELDALVLQYAAGNLRELQALFPGDGVAGINWEEAEDPMREGQVGSNLFPYDEKLWVSLES